MRVPCRLICASVVREVVRFEPNIKAYLKLEVYNYNVCSSTGWFEPYHFGIKIVPRRLKTFFAYAVRNAKAKNSCASAHAGQCSVVRCSDGLV